VDNQTTAETTAQVREWLGTNPPANELLANLPAVELALAESINNRNKAWFVQAQTSAQQLNGSVDLTTVSSIDLAALLRLNLHLIELDAGNEFGQAANVIIQEAKARFDEVGEYWRSSAGEASQTFLTDANAALAESFYLGWRVLDDQTLRPLAGAGLGQVSDAFVPGEGLYQQRDLTEETNAEPNHLGAYTAAVQMFLTATETTGRGTYLSRAQITAQFALHHLEREMGKADALHPIAFAEALIRLARFCSQGDYAAIAAALLAPLQHQMPGIRGAAYALALEHSQHFPLTLVIVGDADNDEHARELWLTGLRRYASARAVRVLHPQRQPAEIQALGYATEDETARAYACIGTVCLPPVHSATELTAILERAGQTV